MESNQKVVWEYDSGGDVVVFEFDMLQRDTKEMFMKWVCFMNAVGYVLDPIDMEKMWDSER